jgi:chaperonin cofactor prefoldin
MNIKKLIKEKEDKIQEIRKNYSALEQQKNKMAQELLRAEGALETLKQLQTDDKK